MSDIPPTTLYCANHPTRETSLRCNKCNKPICVQCAVLTPIGYRCKECVRGQQRVFETATWIDFPVSVIIAIVLAFIGSVVASFGVEAFSLDRLDRLTRRALAQRVHAFHRMIRVD